MLYFQRHFLAVVNGLYGFALFVQLDACEERWMGGNCSFYGCLEPVLVQAAVECIEVGNVIIGLAWMLSALHIKAVL